MALHLLLILLLLILLLLLLLLVLLPRKPRWTPIPREGRTLRQQRMAPPPEAPPQSATSKWAHELGVAVAAAKAAGAVVREGFHREDKSVEQKKNASDLVTETDVKVPFAQGLQHSPARVGTPARHLPPRRRACGDRHCLPQAEKLVLSTIREAFPTHHFIGEEGTAGTAGHELTDEPTWMCGAPPLRLRPPIRDARCPWRGARCCLPAFPTPFVRPQIPWTARPTSST